MEDFLARTVVLLGYWLDLVSDLLGEERAGALRGPYPDTGKSALVRRP